MGRKRKPAEPLPTAEGFIEIASRASSLLELKMLWRSAREWDCLTQQVKDVMTQRAAWLNQNKIGKHRSEEGTQS